MNVGEGARKEIGEAVTKEVMTLAIRPRDGDASQGLREAMAMKRGEYGVDGER